VNEFLSVLLDCSGGIVLVEWVPKTDVWKTMIRIL